MLMKITIFKREMELKMGL